MPGQTMNIKTHLPYLPIISLFSLITLATACSKPPETQTPRQTSDMASDQTPDQSDMPDMTDTTPDTSCTPKTCESLGDVCGMVDDGCGNILDCGTCACVDKKPTTPDCGPCQLGTASCDENNAIACDFPDIPEVTDQIDCTTSFYYVSNLKDQQGDGTKDNPFNTLNAALEAAKTAAPRPLAILVQGNKPYTVQLDVINGVSIIGGFSDRWRYDKDLRSKITSPNTGGDVFGLTARDINTPTLISNLTISNEDAIDGHHNYGATIIDAPKLIIANSIIRAGNGGIGIDGSDGVVGMNGQRGIDGQPGCLIPEVFVEYQGGGVPLYVPCNAGGSSRINNNCPLDTASGKGGDGGHPSTPHTNFKRPSDGQNSPGSNTTKGGSIQVNDRNGRTPPQYMTTAPNGPPGKAVGKIEPSGLWKYTSQATGGNGQTGRNGPGGSGGGSTTLYQDPQFPQVYAYISTPGGGSGGSGGCGGTGGTGGSPGGVSIGIVIVDSPNMSIINSQIYAGEGGMGGTGGQGASGGNGGEGGKGSDLIGTAKMCSATNGLGCSITQSRPTSNVAGNGGVGANGQTGGNGAGGAGGSSIGAYCVSSIPKLTGTDSFVAGLPGLGGGKMINNDPENSTKGEDGLSIKEFGCTL